MAIYQILEEIKDVRKEGELCDFNGYLEDYLEVIDSSEDQPMKDILHALFEENHDLKICVNLRADINRQVISNQIIRYKDAFKAAGTSGDLPGDHLRQAGCAETRSDFSSAQRTAAICMPRVSITQAD